MTTIEIRPEQPADYAAIAAVHVRAFEHRASEALIVALHRQRRAFDPGLSLVAEADGRIVGHALFSPQTIRLLGADVPAVNLAPIAVDGAWQGAGIGGRLIRAGHAAAQGRGYALSFLLGHTSYYPRFGYRTHAYGASALTVPVAATAAGGLTPRTPTKADLPALRALWLHEEGAVDMAIAPGPDLLDWLSPNPAIETLVWADGEGLQGYTRVHRAEPAKPRMFLARSHSAARQLAAALGARSGSAELALPLHPASASAGAFGAPAAAAWDAAMVCPLAPGPFDAYEAELRAGTRPAGRPLWPAAFDLE